MNKRVVITGFGSLVPNFHYPKNGERKDKILKIEDDTYILQIDKRLQRKIDPFVSFGLTAAARALRQARLYEFDYIDMTKVGIFVGNSLGGWKYTESKLQALHEEGVNNMGPYVATAWFPAALQGQLSLLYNIYGYSKTISTHYVAGMQAIGLGVQAIQDSKLRVAICGASESVNTPYVEKILENYSHPHAFPYSFSEGSIFFILEELEHAQERKVNILAEMVLFEDFFAPAPSRNTRDHIHISYEPGNKRIPSLLPHMFAASGLCQLTYMIDDFQLCNPFLSHIQNEEMIPLYSMNSKVRMEAVSQFGNVTALTIKPFTA